VDGGGEGCGEGGGEEEGEGRHGCWLVWGLLLFGVDGVVWLCWCWYLGWLW
jgi:hypothetical protein